MRQLFSITLIFFFLCPQFPEAQITLVPDDLPKAGDSLVYSTDNMVAGLVPGPGGANQTWNFSELDDDERYSVKVVDPEMVPEGENFPDATVALRTRQLLGDQIFSGHIFTQYTESAMLNIGASVVFEEIGDSTLSVFDPPQKVLELPSTAATSFTDSSHLVFEFDGVSFGTDSVRFIFTRKVVVEGDGWGALTTPTGTYQSLRQRVETASADSVYLKSAEGLWVLYSTTRDTVLEFRWLAKEGKGLILMLQVDGEGKATSVTHLTNPDPSRPAPTAAFSIEDLGSGTFAFTDQSVNEPVTWLWDFGDGTTSAAQSPEHTFEEAGEYTVCLTASNAVGADQACQVLTVLLAPIVVFQAEDQGGGVFLFTDESTNSPAFWSWDFGDGATSAEQNPFHTFRVSGTYSVCLTAGNEAGSGEACQSVTVILAPAAAFSFEDQGSGVFTFTDASTNIPESWLWDFGDGNTSTEQSPGHTYSAPGDFVVCLTVANAAGVDQTCQDLSVELAPKVDFTVSLEGLVAAFADQSANVPTNWNWDFGDGATSTEQNPVHTYGNNGQYTVCLSAGNEYGVGEACQTINVTTAPVAGFDFQDQGSGVLSFSDRSRNEPTSWLWDFGDGGSSAEQDPVHTYTSPGAYRVCLTVANDFGADEICRVVNIELSPSAVIEYVGLGGGSFQFADRSTNEPTSWSWDFGDGAVSAEQDPAHTFASPGTYEVCLIAANAFGSGDTCIVLEVVIEPAAFFSYEIGDGGSIQFSDESENGPTSWFWDFGDGNSSQEQDPLHAYGQPGDYTVCLTVENEAGSDQHCQTIGIVLSPVAAFSYQALSGGEVQFTDESANIPAGWLWDFGDGSTSLEADPVHTYASPGAYTVCLTVANDFGTDEICQVVQVSIAPAAAFEFLIQGDGKVQFTDLSANEPTSWAWDFGDGNRSGAQNPLHSFAQAGDYTVCLRVGNAAGSDEICQTVTFGLSPVAGFNIENRGNGRYQFEDQSTNSPTVWRWDFGDGAGSVEQNPVHTYTVAGDYTVCLTAANDFGEDVICVTLSVVLGPVPEALFSIEDLGSGFYSFTDESTNSPTSWFWDFGDGASSTERFAEHLYLKSGKYTVCLTVSNDAGTDQSCRSLNVVLPPSAAFRFEAIGDGGFAFTDESRNNPVEWFWDFGDGATSTERNPEHLYTTSGTYTVCLRAANSAGADENCQSLEISLAPVAAFTYEDRGSGVFAFADASANEPTGWSWDFGDGATSSEKAPTHTYAAPGTYTVCLTAVNGAGSDQECRSLTVALAPVAAFTYEDQGSGVFAFTDASANEPTSWSWDFGDGATSSEKAPSHIYVAPGEYSVCLTAANSGGEDQICQTLTVALRPDAAFTYALNGLKGAFTDASTNEPTSWLWDFGDGNSSREQNPVHTFQTTGEYTVCLTAGNAFGEGESCRTIEVVQAPSAAFDFTDQGLGVFQFDDQTKNSPTSWLWDFGDGATSTEQDPVHNYAGPGEYTVCLTVANEFGSDEICQTVNVTLAPSAAFAYELQAAGIFSFTDESTNSPTSWLWDFGDGTTSTEQDPVHSYAGPGEYVVCLTAANEFGSGEFCQSVKVVLIPAAAFTYEFQPERVIQFIDQSENEPTAWFWDFGDGNTSVAQSPVHEFGQAGEYTVCLTVTNDAGSNEVCQAVALVMVPSALFSFEFKNGGKVSFSDRSTNAPTGWLWDFGDGETSTEQNPSHIYASPGDYTVCLTAVNDFGSDKTCQAVPIRLAPGAEFEIEERGMGEFRFIDRSSNNPDSWYWNFGDGFTSTARNPVHTFTESGTYGVCLRVTNSYGGDETCRTLTLTLGPVAAFQFEDKGMGVFEFTDQSVNSPTSWSWDFGDGNTSTVQNPEHTYANPGDYTVCLTVSNELGVDEICRSFTVILAPEADFSIEEKGSGTFRFRDRSTNVPTSWFWDFGDGNTSTAQNPLHTFSIRGEYTICLSSSNEGGEDEACRRLEVLLAPQAAFTFEVLEGGAVQFADQSTNFPSSWSWDFGDGAGSTEQNPVHTFADDSDYTVCLTASNNGGSDQFCTTVNISATSIVHLPDGMQLTAFPNPAKEYILFRLENNREAFRLILHNLLGQPVYEGILLEQQSIAVDRWASGMYLYQVRTKSGKMLAAGSVLVDH